MNFPTDETVEFFRYIFWCRAEHISRFLPYSGWWLVCRPKGDTCVVDTDEAECEHCEFHGPFESMQAAADFRDRTVH